MNQRMKYYAAIEAGGTKFVCSVISEKGEYCEEIRFPTTSPDETLNRAISFFKEKQPAYSFSAMGIGSFGPVNLDRKSDLYGYITTTPKSGWQFTNILGAFQDAFNLPIGFDTDVNAAALAEIQQDADPTTQNLVYYTIGTGVGAGIILNGEPVHGLVHPEGGHILIRQDFQQDPYAGGCPFHNNCLEGLCAGPTIQARFGKPAQELAENHPFWAILANYLAQACVAQICQTSPQRIVLGGGVMEQKQLFPMIHTEVKRLLNGYIHHPMILERIDQYIIPPRLGNKAGAYGAMTIAKREAGR